MIHTSLLRVPSQFLYTPKIKNSISLSLFDNYIIAGMGGSHIATDIITSLGIPYPIKRISSYSLPDTFDSSTLCICISYSGNTEETLSVLKSAHKEGIQTLSISTGGKLIEFAEINNLPFIHLPKDTIQPRMAVGYLLRALSFVIDKDLFNDLEKLNETLNVEAMQSAGEKLSSQIGHRIPILYASSENWVIANNFKIQFNETGKKNSWLSIFPEHNHNELEGTLSDTNQSQNLFSIFIEDQSDHLRIQKRMSIAKELYTNAGIPTYSYVFTETNRLHNILSAFITGTWSSLYLGEMKGYTDDSVPHIEEFKRSLGAYD